MELKIEQLLQQGIPAGKDVRRFLGNLSRNRSGFFHPCRRKGTLGWLTPAQKQ
ncbi:MAG: hypothetical protein P8M15_03785 [Alphaproteobacteria bacterium]|nr:hypothetical protein [Alphaproteobacteria bacterium]